MVWAGAQGIGVSVVLRGGRVHRICFGIHWEKLCSPTVFGIHLGKMVFTNRFVVVHLTFAVVPPPL